MCHIKSSFSAVSDYSSSPYASINSLDKYGNSVQIRNARLSSLKHGTTIIAAVSTDYQDDGSAEQTDRIIVCSLKPSGSKQLGRVTTNTEMINFLTPLPDDENNSRIVAMVASGLQSDKRFIVSSLRRYSMRVWERFDSVPNCDRMAQACSQVFLAFMGYNIQDEVGDGVKEVIPSNNQKDQFQTSRPFGISTLFLGLSRKGQKSMVEMKAVEPSGVISESLGACALGKESIRANKLLGQKWRRGMSPQQVKDMCFSIMKEIHFEDKDSYGKDNHTEMEIICEIIDSKGSHDVKHISIP